VSSYPLRQVVLKIHSRCDLACDHCYVYQHADQSWATRPRVIGEPTVRQVARRLAEYAEAQRLDSVSVILHGGEPLLAGVERIRGICQELSRAIGPVTALDLRIHTNGLQLNERFLSVFDEFGVRVGISLDGDQAANDRHRRDHRGRSSYQRVLRAVELLHRPEYRHLDLGLLCTVDVANDPVAVHDALTALEPPRIDYLLPHSTWEHPPPGREGAATPYAEWLLRVFDRWEEQGRRVPVRTFASVLSTLRGGPSLTEALGLAPSDLAVVETDGTFEQVDSLKTAYQGAPATGLDVFRHTFEELALHPGVRARQRGIDGVSAACRACPVVESCGGGLYSHRYSAARGFDNPSVYCADLRVFIDGVAERITQRALAPAVHDAEELRFSQVEVNRGLAALLHSRYAEVPAVAEGWRALLALDAAPETATHLNALLSHPYVRTSLRACLEEELDPDRLISVAAAAAIQSGVDAVLGWESPRAQLHLPTLGTVRLPAAGPVEIATGAEGFEVRGAGATVRVRWGDHDGPVRWRPLRALRAGGLLLDDADPYRHCYPAHAAPPLEASEAELFLKSWRAACELLDERVKGWWDAVAVLPPSTLTPLAPGSPVSLGAHAVGALGVPVDAEPESLARGVLRASRQARLLALRESTDLWLPGSGAGRLLEEANRRLAEASFWRPDPAGASRWADALAAADRALADLTRAERAELTASGRAVLEQLRDERAALDG
jgi:uncharacterized protein